MSTPAIDLFLVDPDNDFRRGLEHFLNGSRKVHCRSFADAESTLHALESHLPHVVMLDLHLPGMDGLALIRGLTHRFARTPVLVCTAIDEDHTVFEALRAGAMGYLLKHAVLDGIIHALHDIVEGGSPMSPSITRRLVNRFRPSGKEDLNALTEREQNVLDLLATGMSAVAVAQQLKVTANTVRTHIKHIYEKLHAHNRVEAIAKGRRGG
jgi:DNA-binding NarL/FixJ family response regulator